MVSRTTHDLLFDPVPCLSSPTVSQRLTHTQFLLSSSYLMISQGKKDEVLRVGSSRNSSAFPYISLFFFCFFFFFFVVEIIIKVDGHFRPEVEIQKADRVDHPSDLSPLPPNQKKDEKLLSISLKITNLIDISSSLNILVLSQMTHTPVG